MCKADLKWAIAGALFLVAVVLLLYAAGTQPGW